MPLDQLSLSALLPSSGREGVSLVFDYLLWLSTERGISVRTEGLVVGGLGWVEGCGCVVVGGDDSSARGELAGASTQFLDLLWRRLVPHPLLRFCVPADPLGGGGSQVPVPQRVAGERW